MYTLLNFDKYLNEVGSEERVRMRTYPGCSGRLRRKKRRTMMKMMMKKRRKRKKRVHTWGEHES